MSDIKRINYKILLIFLSFIVFCCSFGLNYAKADEQTIIPTEIDINYDDDGIMLPSLIVEGYKYKISLYEINDVEFTNCIAENIQFGKFDSPQVGSYLLKYELTNIESGSVSVKTAVLNILDVQAPEIFLKTAYLDSYVKGNVLEISDVTIYDNSGETITDSTYKVFYEENDVTGLVENNKITLTAGEYIIVYQAEDSAGNKGELKVYISVAGEKTESSGCAASMGGFVDNNNMLGNGTLMILTLSAIFVVRHGINKKYKKEKI